MALVFVLGTFGMNFQITTALMATQEFGKVRRSSACSARSWRSGRWPQRYLGRWHNPGCATS